VEALVAGARDAVQLSVMALGSVRRKIPQLAVALEGQCTAHHATRMAGALAVVDVLGRQSVELEQQRQEWLGPMAPQLEQLDSLPGVNAITARDMLAELGAEQQLDLRPSQARQPRKDDFYSWLKSQQEADEAEKQRKDLEARQARQDREFAAGRQMVAQWTREYGTAAIEAFLQELLADLPTLAQDEQPPAATPKLAEHKIIVASRHAKGIEAALPNHCSCRHQGCCMPKL